MMRSGRAALAACALVAALVACGGSSREVRQSAVASTTAVVSWSADEGQSADWWCGGADLQATFAPSFTGDALVDAIKAAIADPQRPDAAFSFVDPIESFFTDFDNRALCITIRPDERAAKVTSLVSQLRSSGNVVSVRTR